MGFLAAIKYRIVEMNVEVYTKEKVESIPFGNLSVSITGSNYWTASDRVHHLTDTISLLLEDAYIRASIPACALLLRLVVVTCDIQGEITHWQRQLERPVAITKNAEGMTAGKCLVWGSGDIEATFAVIIVSEEIGVDLVNDEETLRNSAKALLVHELAHIHDDFIHLDTFGRSEPPMNNDWHGIQHAIAIATWGEYFAESIAAPYFKDETSKLQMTLFFELINGCLHRIQQAISEYQSHDDIVVLWQVAGGEISNMFCHFGRVIGLLRSMYPDDNTVLEQVFDTIFKLSRSWGQVARRLDLELNTIAGQHKWDSQTFLGLEDVVARGFNSSGLYPMVDGWGLQVIVKPPRDNWVDR